MKLPRFNPIPSLSAGVIGGVVGAGLVIGGGGYAAYRVASAPAAVDHVSNQITLPASPKAASATDSTPTPTPAAPAPSTAPAPAPVTTVSSTPTPTPKPVQAAPPVPTACPTPPQPTQLAATALSASGTASTAGVQYSTTVQIPPDACGGRWVYIDVTVSGGGCPYGMYDSLSNAKSGHEGEVGCSNGWAYMSDATDSFTFTVDDKSGPQPRPTDWSATISY